MECPVCKNNNEFRLVEIWREYKLYYCHFCQVVFSEPMKNPGPTWYEKSEMYTQGKKLSLLGWDLLGWHHKQFIQDKEIYGESLLDVGCGNGMFLKEAQRLGYVVTGIDFDRGNIKIAKERFNLEDVFCITLEEFINSFSNKRFDIITLFEVLEHIDNPDEFIELVKKVLKPGGYIAISVPNRERFGDPFGEGDYPPHHLTRWNAQAIKYFLENKGFDIIKLKTDDVAGCLKAKIRFGIATRMVQKGMIQHNPDVIHNARKLMKIKDIVFNSITMLLAVVLKPFKLQGVGIYILARLR